ncbi:DUF1206 domain-containing protein [Brevundimonas nasdae]|uniref:DUF1206 domain-containing protein n=1 Tax=Brevundimonas nasdae TaxID=172043 RepID=UPI00301791A6
MNAAKTLRLPPLATLIEWAARVGYGARGFVYLSAGALTLLAATDRIGDAVGTSGAAGWLAEQPFGKVWLVLLGLGLWAFVGWRVLQAVFDADHEGTDLKGWTTRAGQAASGLFYGVLASGVFEYLDEFGEATNASAAQAESVAENQEKAAMLLGMPFGEVLLIGRGWWCWASASAISSGPFATTSTTPWPVQRPSAARRRRWRGRAMRREGSPICPWACSWFWRGCMRARAR